MMANCHGYLYRRVMPGGSQYFWTGSLTASKVALAPNGGLAVLNLSKAQGVIGSSSGLRPRGSDGSQLGAPPVTAQAPEKSGTWAMLRAPCVAADGVGATVSAMTSSPGLSESFVHPLRVMSVGAASSIIQSLASPLLSFTSM